MPTIYANPTALTNTIPALTQPSAEIVLETSTDEQSSAPTQREAQQKTPKTPNAHKLGNLAEVAVQCMERLQEHVYPQNTAFLSKASLQAEASHRHSAENALPATAAKPSGSALSSIPLPPALVTPACSSDGLEGTARPSSALISASSCTRATSFRQPLSALGGYFSLRPYEFPA